MDREEFERYIDRVPFSGCWIWMGFLAGPYGAINRSYWEPRRKSAHRLSYELYKGPIPEGLHVLHLCDVKCCTNPEHLYLGDQVDNMIDCMTRQGLFRPNGEVFWLGKDKTK